MINTIKYSFITCFKHKRKVVIKKTSGIDNQVNIQEIEENQNEYKEN